MIPPDLMAGTLERTGEGLSSLQVFARLRDGVTSEQAHDELNAIARRLAGTHKENEGWSAIVRPLVVGRARIGGSHE